MRVQFTFVVNVPDNTLATTLKEAGRCAVGAAENAVERQTEPKGAPGGTCVITILANHYPKDDR